MKNQKQTSQEEIDEILKKLSGSGYQGLSADEKRTLVDYKSTSWTKLEFILFIIFCFGLLAIGIYKILFAETAPTYIRSGIYTPIKLSTKATIIVSIIFILTALSCLQLYLKDYIKGEIVFRPFKNKKERYKIIFIYAFLLAIFTFGILFALPFGLILILLERKKR